MTKKITIEAIVNAPVEKVWKFWNEPAHITQWAFASPDWHAPKAENDLRVDGKFSTTMAAKDGSFSFEFGGVYTNVKPNTAIDYVMSDGREVNISFSTEDGGVKIVQAFDPESENPEDMQRQGWQAILNNFKQYAERTND